MTMLWLVWLSCSVLLLSCSCYVLVSARSLWQQGVRADARAFDAERYVPVDQLNGSWRSVAESDDGSLGHPIYSVAEPGLEEFGDVSRGSTVESILSGERGFGAAPPGAGA